MVPLSSKQPQHNHEMSTGMVKYLEIWLQQMLDTDLTVPMWHIILSLVSDLTEHWGLSMFYTYLPQDLTVWYWYTQTATDIQYKYSRYLGIWLSLYICDTVYGKQFAATVSRWYRMTNALRQLATFHFTSLRLTEAVAVLTCGSGEEVLS